MSYSFIVIAFELETINIDGMNCVNFMGIYTSHENNSSNAV